jgi:two-component system CheB/CheR fusion protein
MEQEHEKQITVVGIGASAGGLEALRLLIPNLPVQSDIAFIIAQHLDPKHSSMLRDILARENEISIKEVEDKEHLEGGVLYIIPPGKDAYLKDHAITLKSATGIGPKPSINRLFVSMAEELGEQAVGVILSGTGSDGAHGIRAIKAEGGITIAQDEQTAKFPSMPMSAIETSNIDIIMKPEDIGKRLLGLIQYPRQIPDQEKENLDDNDFLGRILIAILNQTGTDFRDYKPTTIYRRIERRMAIHKIFDLQSYLSYLESEPEEIQQLHKDILISVTDFFRDTEAFNSLKEYLPKLIDPNKGEFRVWVPGCATGQEAYSIAILLAEHLGNRITHFNIQIFATDLDDDALAVARQGIYPASLTTQIDQKILEKYFSYANESWQLKNSIRDMVLFARHNVIKDPPFSHLDLISCRNLLIYFNPDLQKKVLQLFHYALRPDALLFLGKSETTGSCEQLYIPVERQERIYRKRNGVRSRIPSVDIGLSRLSEVSDQFSLLVRQTKEQPVSPRQMLQDRLIDIFSPDCIILDSLHNINYVQGDVSLYLRFNQGRMGLSIFDLVLPELRQELRALIYKARREADTLVKSRKINTQYSSESLTVQVKAKYFERDAEFILIFENEPVQQNIQLPKDEEIDQQLLIRIKSLEEELKETSESLQTTIEELETSNEELQSTYEEAQSTNEELYTSTEELQTSNEELQSANEELRTLNEEISTKSQELEKANLKLQDEISERQAIEKKLRNQERKLRRIIEAEPAWVNICDCGGRILHVNRAGVDIMEADSPEDMIDKKLVDFALNDYYRDIIECQQKLEKGQRCTQLIEAKTFKGSHRWLEIHSVLLPKDDDDTCFMSIILDQTQYKQTEQELALRREELSQITRLNTLGAMTSSIAHEINQPLTAISSYISGCELRLKNDGCNDKALLKTIEQTRQQVKRAGDIINHIKNFIKQGEENSISTDVNAAVNNVITLLKDAGQLGKIRPDIQLADNLPPVMAAATQLEQVIINFIINALEAMTDVEKPMLKVTTRCVGNEVEVTVQDNGIGIKDNRKADIFKPFYTTKPDGMGMGLNISHSIIESYAGQCHVKNAKDGGTIMSFVLPVLKDE